MRPESFESPRLTALRAEIDIDRGGAIERFWAEMERNGTPLIERFPDDPTAILVSFVWREREPLRNLRIFETLSSVYFHECAAEPIPGTDVWVRSVATRSDIRSQYKFIPNDSLVPRTEEPDMEARMRTWVRDPLNFQPLIDEEVAAQPRTRFYDSSVFEGPDAAPLPWPATEPAAFGTIVEEQFKSEILQNERPVWIYTPPGYDPSAQPLPLLIHFDGEVADSVMRLPRTLDALISHGAIPPIAGLFIGNVDRGNELPCNPNFARSVAEEIMPFVRGRFNISADPAQVVAAGQSYGGLASSYLAFQHPDVVGNVVSQSGSFWWKPDPFNAATRTLAGDSLSYEWLSDQVVSAARKPVRFWLEAGTLETRTMNGEGPSLLDTNRHFRRLLEAKGYEVAYREYAGGHEYAWWRGTIADGLIWAFQG